MTVTLPSIAILGAGSMGGAILSGLVKPGVSVDGGIRITTNRVSSSSLADNVTAFAIETDANANRKAVTDVKIVVVAVKPAKVLDLLAEVADSLPPDAIVVSVAAGVTTTSMEAVVSGSVIRGMPNTPAIVGRGVTGLAAGSRASKAELAMVTELFDTVGTVLVVPESQIDALSTISGSGPAYVYYFIEELTKTAVKLGFTPENASRMVGETFLGASELLAASESTPEQLRKQVTSPNGTTERAITELARADLSGLFDRATAAALARAKELASGA